MAIDHPRGPIVVGVDGSDGTADAVRWAAAEAAARRTALRLVHAYSFPMAGYPGMWETKGMHDLLVEQGHDWLRRAAAAVDRQAPQVEVHTELLHGGSVPVLAEASRHARLVVVGSRGLGGIPRLLLGSTAEGLAGQAHCPVAVVPNRQPEPAGLPDTAAPVVVGVDGSPVSDAAVAVGFDEASRRNVGLVAVHSWDGPPVTDPFTIMLSEQDWTEAEDGERRLLAEQLAGWHDKYPDVDVHRTVVRARPAVALLEHAATAQLLVVGNRGRGGIASTLLGSTSRAVLHHAPCPVIVVGPDRDR